MDVFMKIDIACYAIVKFNIENVISLVGNFYNIIHVPHGLILI